MDTKLSVRPSPIAGQWYSADPHRLAREVDGYINSALPLDLPGEVVAVIAPHAGHRYSGTVAGYAFAALRGIEPELVAVISPMHHYYQEGLLTSAHSAYQTPLGSIPIDQEAVSDLDGHIRAELGRGLTPVYNDPEHSLEIELPFLQRALKAGFQLLPVMVRDQTTRAARALGAALAKTIIKRAAILVASTDLSHFYPQGVAEQLDAEMLKRIENFDPQGIMQAEEEGKGFACGKAALAAVLWAAKDLGASEVKILRYATSGEVTGDFGQVVGYSAAVVLRGTQAGSRITSLT